MGLKVAVILLAYKNHTDVENAIKNLNIKLPDSDVFLIDSFYDDETSSCLRTIALKYNVRFFKTIENKGYGTGNNYGLKEAKNLGYDFFIVMNPDIEIIDFNLSEIVEFKGCVIGPKIIKSNGADQNPYWVHQSSLAERVIYLGAKHRLRVLVLIGIIYHKLLKYFFVKKNMIQKVFALHGSFVIFHSEVLNKIGLPYDENIFLFAEEEDLALELKQQNVPSIFNPNLIVKHFEDGSSGHLEDEFLESISRESIIYKYEKWHS